MDKQKQLLMSVLGVFALVIVTVGASFAFFNYSRTGNTSNSIQSGDISFTYSETKDVTLANAFPVADAIGSHATGDDVYKFAVNGTVTSTDVAVKYNVTLISNNTKTVDPAATAEQIAAGTHVKGYFTNDQIKVQLVRNETDYLAGGANSGVLVSSLDGFNAGTTIGSGILASDVTLTSTGDNYEMRIWIDENVDYSNYTSAEYAAGAQDDQTATGKYNGYEYSLKVKVDATAVNNYGKTNS